MPPLHLEIYMPTNLTGNTIASTYDQLLHIDGGPTATPKPVYSGTGTATALRVSTVNVEVDNLRFDGNSITSTNTNGNLNFTPNGSGSVVITNVSFASMSQARTALGLGTIATQDSDNVSITGGSISGATFTGNVPITSITDINYGIFYDLSDQTFTAVTATPVTFDTVGITDDISVVSNTRITFANAGTYEITTRLQFSNSGTSDRLADIWFRLDGADIPNSASEISVPKVGDGGRITHTITGILTVTAGQYIETIVAVANASVTLNYQAPLVTPGDPIDRPAVPSAILVARRIS